MPVLKIRLFNQRIDDLLRRMDLQSGMCLGLAFANLAAALALLLKTLRVV